ncbi:MAG: hypothetical protein K6F96_06085 [Bacteroidales bacterium]|nr:hypothetical protein [Bacteroidales bacterium]
MENNDYSGPRVRQCEDGKYRWKYEMNMLTNPTIFLTVFKIFFYIILVGFVIFGTFLYAIHGDWEGLWGMAKAMLIAMGIFFVLTLLGVLVLAIMYRGKYVVLFEMDEKEIAHIQEPRQFRKAQKIGAVTAMAGVGAGNYTAAGAGLLSATKNSSTSILANVRRVKPRRWLNLIKVNQLLNKNQIYVPKEDFDFVYNFLKEHCPNAK